MKAVFIDRGGVLYRDWESGITGKPQDLVLEKGALQSIRDFQKQCDHRVFFMDNCEGLAFEKYTESAYQTCTDLFKKKIQQQGIRVDGWYTCAYHSKGKGKFRRESVFTFPNVGIFKQAQQEYDVDLETSWVVGDRTPELLAGSRAQCQTMLVRTGLQGKDGEYFVEPDLIVNHLREGFRHILEQEIALTR